MLFGNLGGSLFTFAFMTSRLSKEGEKGSSTPSSSFCVISSTRIGRLLDATEEGRPNACHANLCPPLNECSLLCDMPEEVVFQKVLVCLLVALGSFPTVDSIDMRKQFHFSSSSQIDSELISHQCSESHSKM